MCKIIQFPVRESNSYQCLVKMYEECDTVEKCGVFIEMVENFCKSGRITVKEMYTLRRIGRQKCIQLATPEQEPEKAEKAGVYYYTPEMGQKKPEGCQMEAGLCFYGGHYWVYTPLKLKGRGITENETQWDAGSKKQVEKWRSYTVTRRAFEKLRQQYTISMEGHLD